MRSGLQLHLFVIVTIFVVLSGTLYGQSRFEAVRPILAGKCLECHGDDAPKADLNLSTRENLLQGGASGPAIVPGKATESLLFKKITHADSPGMPYKREKLSADEIKQIAAWIDGGSEYDAPLQGAREKHWSLKPLQPQLPPTTKSRWAKTPIDRFILAKLEEQGMKPSESADKRTLLRRVTFDLTGLPPTPEELRDFEKDKSPDAFAKVVDRLLASPRYGERWARHWLDVVHYADTHGHDQDLPRDNAWPYRDYVIQSFNDDKPYAQFVEEQLAGDVLFPSDPNGIVATGFIAAGPWDLSSLVAVMEDTTDKKVARYLDRDDMVMTTMSTFVSSTVHCARCHNHKFDPIPQADYYNLQAVFAGVDRADRPYDLDPSTNALRQKLLREKTAVDVKQKDRVASLLSPEIAGKVAAWEQSLLGDGIWTVLDPTHFTSAAGATLTKQSDHSLLASGEDPLVDTYEIVAHTDLQNITAIRLETLTDASHPRKGPGRVPENGNFHLSEFQVFATSSGSTNVVQLALQNPTADFNQDGWTIDKALDGDTNTAWGVHPETEKPHYAVFEFAEDVSVGRGVTLKVVLQQVHGRKHTILRPRLSVTNVRRPVRALALPDNVKKILAVDAAQRTEDQRRDLAAYVLVQEIEKEIAALPKPLAVYAAANDFKPKMNFTPAKVPRDIHVLRRGDVNKPGDPAFPGALSCVEGLPARFDLSDLSDEGARRAALAKWITHPNNVLTWRSIVNRVWHYHFGKGIVDTPNDFGRMGSSPTHPELLDWLAIWFRDNGGSIKALHRMILTSAVYQQSSAFKSKYAEIDANNSLLWRMNRVRLDAESVRDAVLQIAGKLDLTMGGPPVKQFHMEPIVGLNTPVIDYNRFDVDTPGNFRRSVYRFLFRSIPDPFMDTLDCADASQLTAVRNVSMTALQALALWNNAFVLRQSEHFAARLAAAEEKTDDQIYLMYELALGRAPTRSERQAIKAYAAKHGLANACRVILNSNEFMFVN